MGKPTDIKKKLYQAGKLETGKREDDKMLGLFGNDVARRFAHDQKLVHSEVTD